MTQEEILKAFNNRWRIKSTELMELDTSLFHRIKELCLDFFKIGIIIGQLDNEFVTDGICNGRIVREDEVVPAPDFNTWWNLYQKKRGREKCMKKWAKLSAKDRQACIQATPAYVQSTPDVTYRKDPYTYLNNKSWNDTIYFRNNPDSQRQQRLAASANLIAGYAAEGYNPQSEVPEAD